MTFKVIFYETPLLYLVEKIVCINCIHSNMDYCIANLNISPMSDGTLPGTP